MIFLILALILVALVVIFALQNTVVIPVTFLMWTFHGSLALVLLIALAVGVLIALLTSLPSLVKNSLTIRSHKKKISAIEEDLSDHKSKLEEAERKLQEQQQPSTASTPLEQPPDTDKKL